MYFMTRIIELLNDASDFFYQIYRETRNWIYPFYYISDFFWDLCDAFNDLAWYFYDFALWVNDAAGKVEEILSYHDIYSYFRDFLDAGWDAWMWVLDAAGNIRRGVDSWWASVRYDVMDWIDAAGDALEAQMAGLASWVDDIQAFIDELEIDFPDISGILDWFTDWGGHVLATVNTWWNSRLLEVQELINSAAAGVAAMAEGWQEVKSDVVEFFNDPLEWLWTRFTDWFLGPEV